MAGGGGLVLFQHKLRARRSRPLRPSTLRLMHTIELSDDELRLVQSALRAFLEDFGHNEADVLRRIKALIAKLPPQSG
jgi:hypothetical protein